MKLYAAVIYVISMLATSVAFAEEGHHDEHEDEHGHGHEQVTISEDAAAAAGVQLATAGQMQVDDMLTLTGRVVLNRNTTAQVHARFAGLVKSVKAEWGDTVKKGDALATIEANESLRTYTIHAPMDGTVLKRNTNIGNVAGSEALFTIADLSQVWAEFHVFPRDLSEIKEGQHVHVRAIETEREIKAPITLILPTADALSQTVIAVVAIDNASNDWRPGMTVEGDVHVAQKTVPVAVTNDAVQRMEGQQVVFVYEDGAYEPRPVKLGTPDDTYVEVLDGVSAGERYVSHGSFIIKAELGKESAGHSH